MARKIASFSRLRSQVIVRPQPRISFTTADKTALSLKALGISQDGHECDDTVTQQPATYLNNNPGN